MSYVSPDMDRRLWIVAESNDPQTVARFEAENPSLVAELAKRTAMVQALRSAKPGAGGFGVPPEFHPRAPRGIPRPVLYGSGALAFAALALASFYITGAMLNPPRQPAVAPAPEHDRTPIVLPQDDKGRSVASVPPARTTPTRPSVSPPIGSAPSSGQARPGGVQGRSGVDRFSAPEEENLPLTLKLESAPLLSVIEAIAAQAGYQVHVAPGFENRTVSVDIAGRDEMHLLQTLGKQHGFTVFDEGENRILVIPAVDGGPEPLNEG